MDIEVHGQECDCAYCRDCGKEIWRQQHRFKTARKNSLRSYERGIDSFNRKVRKEISAIAFGRALMERK